MSDEKLVSTVQVTGIAASPEQPITAVITPTKKGNTIRVQITEWEKQ